MALRRDKFWWRDGASYRKIGVKESKFKLVVSKCVAKIKRIVQREIIWKNRIFDKKQTTHLEGNIIYG